MPLFVLSYLLFTLAIFSTISYDKVVLGNFYLGKSKKSWRLFLPDYIIVAESCNVSTETISTGTKYSLACYPPLYNKFRDNNLMEMLWGFNTSNIFKTYIRSHRNHYFMALCFILTFVRFSVGRKVCF